MLASSAMVAARTRFSVFGSAALLTILVGAAAYARAPACDISPIRGAMSPAGAQAVMRVVNDGTPCGLVNFGLPNERRNEAHDGTITQTPKHGRAEFSRGRVDYTPNAGYVGEDEFAYEARAVGSGGREVTLRVRVKVTILPGR